MPNGLDLKISKENCRQMLEEGYITTNAFQSQPLSRLEYLSENVFNFFTSDTKCSELFAKKALEVCSAINDDLTFEYIKQPEGHLWYLLMINMPFFNDKLDWGSSINGAWWSEPFYKNKKIEFSSCGLFLEGKQIDEMLKFTYDEWRMFIYEVIRFGSLETENEN